MAEAIFVSFEGVDGAGKTTQITLLAEHMRRAGRSVEVFREPGGTELGEHVRELLLGGGEVSPWAEASLFAAARAQLVACAIRPALDAGTDVICDRYLDSSVAYQGAGRQLGTADVLAWNLLVTGGLLPDVTFLLELTAAQAETRLEHDSGTDSASGRRPPDRLERESAAFRTRVAAAYAELAAGAPERFARLAGDRSADAIAAEIADRIDTLLAEPRQT